MIGEDATYSCNTCKRTFKNYQNVQQHYRHVHLKLRPKLRKCNMCDVKVPGHQKAAHMEQHHGVPAPTCGACGRKFSYPNQVLRHQKHFHMGEKTFSCRSCDMLFATQSKLALHSIKHTEMRNYKCEFCGKSFKWRKNLKTHIMMHLDIRNHVCVICNVSFVQQSSLKYHKAKRHPETI